MGWLSKLKKTATTAATGGLNIVAKKAAKSPVAMTIASGGANLALKNKKIKGAVDKISYPIGKRVGAVATALRAPSIAKNINITQALTDPKKYAQENLAAYGKDVGFAKDVYGHLKKGNFQGLKNQFVSDMKGAGKALKTGKAPAVAWALETPPVPAADTMAPTMTQLTGETPLYPSDTVVSPPAMAVEGGAASKMPIIIGAAVALVVVLAVVVMR